NGCPTIGRGWRSFPGRQPPGWTHWAHTPAPATAHVAVPTGLRTAAGAPEARCRHRLAPGWSTGPRRGAPWVYEAGWCVSRSYPRCVRDEHHTRALLLLGQHRPHLLAPAVRVRQHGLDVAGVHQGRVHTGGRLIGDDLALLAEHAHVGPVARSA